MVAISGLRWQTTCKSATDRLCGKGGPMKRSLTRSTRRSSRAENTAAWCPVAGEEIHGVLCPSSFCTCACVPRHAQGAQCMCNHRPVIKCASMQRVTLASMSMTMLRMHFLRSSRALVCNLHSVLQCKATVHTEGATMRNVGH